jgi:hypothetical protein
MADEKEGKGGGNPVGGALKHGVDIIKWTVRPSTSATMTEGGFAHCVPEGYTEQDMDGGNDVSEMLLKNEFDNWQTTYKWHLSASWKSNVTLNGKGLYITDATMAVTSEHTSLHLGWEWNIHFPGKGRWVNRQQEFVELPFTIEIKCSDTVVVDTLINSSQWRGALRGDGQAWIKQQ